MQLIEIMLNRSKTSLKLKSFKPISSKGLITLGFIGIFFSMNLAAKVTQTQVISLTEGWNAVYLEVDPEETDPSLVFADTPIEIAATYFQLITPVTTVTNPGERKWKEEGWGVWYSPARTDSFLSSLYAVQGNHSYLLYVKEDYNWEITGTPALKHIKWKVNSFNLVGFPVDPQSPPSFDSYFAGSEGFLNPRIYRLDNSTWKQVLNLNERMRSGEAYWVYCQGHSEFQGPLTVTLPFGRELDFGSFGHTLELDITNSGPGPYDISFETISGISEIPLSYQSISDTPFKKSYHPLPPKMSLPTLAAGDSTQFTLHLLRENLEPGEQSTLLKLSTNTGIRYWIPVTAVR